jgi:uncharacterized protein YcfL
MGPRAISFCLVSAAALALAACHGPVNVVSASSDAVVVRHTPDAGYAAEDQAQRYCAQYNKKARLRSTASEPTNEQLTIYDCVPL